MASVRMISQLRHFSLLTRITRVSAEGMAAMADLHGKQAFCGLEAMAQLAALHVRHAIQFRRHAFLLKVTRCRWPVEEILRGSYRLMAEQYGRSSQGFGYRVRALGPCDETLDADLLIGTRPYDRQFREDILEAHYRNIFNRLQPDG